MNKDYTNLSIKRSLDAELRYAAQVEQRTPQGMIAYWLKEWMGDNEPLHATQPFSKRSKNVKGDRVSKER